MKEAAGIPGQAGRAAGCERLAAPFLALALLSSTALVQATECVSSSERLCLNQERFAVEVSWSDFEGLTGQGQSIPLTEDTGAFWFFDADNIELVLKVLDGRSFNGHFWVFYGALSNVEYTITVTDMATGAEWTSFNPLEEFGSVGDIEALPGGGGADNTAAKAERWTAAVQGFPAGEMAADRALGSSLGGPTCAPAAERLCLNQERFAVEATWRDFEGGTGTGKAIPLTADTGAFWFFDPDNIELILKVLDGRFLTGHFWVFYGALSNVEYTITVTDMDTGLRRTYQNPSGQFASVGDVEALSGRPLTGHGFTPRYFASVDVPWVTPDNVAEFFSELNANRLGVFAIHGDWFDLVESDGDLFPGFAEMLEQFPEVRNRVVGTVQLAEVTTGLPRVDPAWESDGTWEAWNAHDGWEGYIDGVVRLVARHRLPAVALGVEINQFARNFPDEFDHFAGTVFPAIVEAVRELLPDTLVFPNFQFEWMIGDLVGFADHNGVPGCDGCVPFDQINSLSGRHYPAMVDVLTRFPPEALTHVGFTTYPYFNRDFGTPGEMPEDYYSRLYDMLPPSHRHVHLAFTESGWPANEELSEGEACLICQLQEPETTATCFPEFEPDSICTAERIEQNIDHFRDWLGSEAEQAEFVVRFDELMESVGPSLVFWSFLHDADERNILVIDGLFAHIGLRTHDGSEDRPSLPLWRQLWAPE